MNAPIAAGGGKLLRAGYRHHPKQSRWTVEATNLMRDFLAGKLDSSDLVDRAKALKHKTLLEA